MPDPIFSLERVNVARGDRTVLTDINLSLAAGEHLAILGPNGCGKSTLLKTLTCELYPLAVNPDGTRPTVRIFGRERWDLTQLRQRLGVVSADLPGKPTLSTTGLDAILTGFFASSTLWPNLTVTSPMRERAEQLLVQVGAQHLRSQLVGQMSAGQQRRIMIARALAGSRAAQQGGVAQQRSFAPQASVVQERIDVEQKQAAIGIPQKTAVPSNEAPPAEMLLLDEPSNALDLAAQQDLRNLLRHLAQSGVTILLITHHTADIIPEIGRILLLHHGRVAADGKKTDLLTPSRLSALFETTLDVTERDGYFHTW